MNIIVDADACPVKEEVLRVARRHHLEVTLVANSRMRLPKEKRLRLVVVSDGFDAADDWIVARVQPLDVVVTADVVLASRCVKAGARVLGPGGKPFTEDNVGQAVAMRDLMADLRSADPFRQGGGKGFTKADRSRFLDALEREIRAVLA